MTTKSNGPEEKKPGDEANWAQPVSKLKVDHAPAGAVNLNVEGRQVVGPLQGFGQLWQKTYSVRLSGAEVSARELIKTWKENFDKFWPEGSRFYAPIAGIAPGEVAIINLAQPGGMVLSTGIMRPHRVGSPQFTVRSDPPAGITRGKGNEQSVASIVPEGATGLGTTSRLEHTPALGWCGARLLAARVAASLGSTGRS